MLGWFTGLGIWIKVAIFAAIIGLAVGAVWYIHHSIWQDGYNAAEAKYKLQLQALENKLKTTQSDLDTAVTVNKAFDAEVQRLAVIVKDQNLSIAQYKADTFAAQARAREALARVAVTEKRYSAEIARLKEIVNGPPMTEGDCEEADVIMRSILRDRLSNPGSAPAPNRPAAQGGDGPGGGVKTVH